MANDAKVGEVIDVGAGGAELEAYQEDGGILTGFIAGIGKFLTKARSLEEKADAIAVRAKAIQPPASAEEDAAVQRFVQEANGATKAIEEHWGVTSAFSRFHRKLTAARERAADKSRGAAERAQRLHNQYVEGERRRAVEETARREREARDEAERKRAKEIADAEAEAVKREEQMTDLSERERRFVELFAFGLNTGETAARSAGFKDPRVAASRLLGQVKIVNAIKAAQEAQAIRKQAEARKSSPLEVREVEPEKPAIQKEGTDRTTWRGELVDLDSLMTAFLGCKPADYQNRYGIPADLFTIDQAKLTEYARSLHDGLNRWPGVKAIKKTSTI